jgi:hypothetical protein
MNTFGFIITRHVNSEKTNKYWNNSVKLLRYFYPNNKIIIIDDNSNLNFLKNDFDYKNTTIIQSEFLGRGELLPYYYFIKYKFFDNAVILHDSVFFHKRVNFEKLIINNIKVLPLWHFNYDNENINNTKRITMSLNNSYKILLNISNNTNFMETNKWNGCFGVQSFINHTFLLYLQEKYRITNLITEVKTRPDRCCIERILGCIFCLEYDKLKYTKSLFGNIFSYQKWGYTYDEYKHNLKFNIIPAPIVKVWSGR